MRVRRTCIWYQEFRSAGFAENMTARYSKDCFDSVGEILLAGWTYAKWRFRRRGRIWDGPEVDRDYGFERQRVLVVGRRGRTKGR